jgi:hypothetical protein
VTAHQAVHPIATMCRVLGVSPSGTTRPLGDVDLVYLYLDAVCLRVHPSTGETGMHMSKNLFGVLICALTGLAAATLGAQPPPPVPEPQFGPCYPIVVQNRGVSIDLTAVATNAYTVTLMWSGFAGVYEVSSSGPGTPFRGSVTLAPPARLAPRGSVPIAPRFRQPAPPQLFPGTVTHGQASPGTQYAYTIIGTLTDGRKACGQATATTPPAPEEAAPARPLGPPPVQTVPTLTVFIANANNAFSLYGISWQMKMDRLGAFLVASGQVPDVISITEISGWTSCTTPASDNSGDYDMVDRLIGRLRDGIGVTYRVAYLIGAEGNLGGVRCHYYTGDAVLYNPHRVTNLTPGDVATSPQVAHNTNHLGFLVRRSLPICYRGARTSIPNLEKLIDGPPQFDKCNRATPSGPARVWQERNSDGGYRVIATLARFGLVGVPGSSFDVVTLHPSSEQESRHEAPINSFVAAVTAPPYRNTRPNYPTIVLGDFNALADSGTAWPVGTTQVFRAPEDVMVASLGTGTGALPPLRVLNVVGRMTLPNERPCRPQTEDPAMRFFSDRSFSDHCGLLVRFSE